MIENKLLSLVSSYEEMEQIMKSYLTLEDYEEFKEIEDKLGAYEGGYYDTHDLDYIGDNLEEYEAKYLELIELATKEWKKQNESNK